MTTRTRRMRLPGALPALFAALMLALPAAAATGADGTWRLRVELSSFHTGPIGGFDELVQVKDGKLEATLSRRFTQLALSLAISDGAVSGRLALTPDDNWMTASQGFQGVVANGVFEREIDVPALYMLWGDEGADPDSRVVVVHMRLERQ